MDKYLIKKTVQDNTANEREQNDKLCASSGETNKSCPLSNQRPTKDEQSNGGAKAVHKSRSFQPSWVKQFPWVVYEKSNDVIFCKVCKETFEKQQIKLSHKIETTFIDKGFCNWKKGIEKLKIHEKSACHREAVMKYSASKQNINVSCQLTNEKLKQMKENRFCLLKLISTLRYLAVQGSSIRGHIDDKSNFKALLQLRCEDSQALKNWMERHSYKWISHDIQNELLSILNHSLLRKLIADIKDAKYFSIIGDETTDISTQEQFSICLRFVHDSLEIDEYFLGLYSTDNTSSQNLFDIITDILMRFNLPISDCRGQCYDGAANMAGVYNGVRAKFTVVETKAVFVHCLAHSLNLVLQDTLKEIPECRNVLGVIKDLINFVKDSPKRLALFTHLKHDDSANLRPLCPTRWTIRYLALSSVLSNYIELQTFFSTVNKNDRSDSSYKANGFLMNMQTFDFFFTLSVMVKLFAHTDTVNTALQGKKLHFGMTNKMIATLSTTIQFMRENFDTFWNETTEKATKLDIESPKLPRKRRVPRKYDESNDQGMNQFSDIKGKYRKLYYEVMDVTLSCLESRFNTQTSAFLQKIEDFLLGHDNYKDEILCFYASDIDKDRLLLHRNMFFEILQGKGAGSDNSVISSFDDLVAYLKKEQYLQALLPELVKFVKIVLTVPVTTCTAERSFSGLRRLKTYLRSVMRQDRLNAVSIINCHRDEAMKLDLDTVADEFIARNELRRNTYNKVR